MLRRRTLVQLLIFALAGWTTAASGNATVRIMTQNMDAGTDQGYIIAALQGAMSLQLRGNVVRRFLAYSGECG